MSSTSTTSKRPPKLRAACNECHAAKVRCSGEKTGCQRCANLGLGCVFAISRIGKVPGKRSKANRAAAAAAAAAASASTSTLASVSTSSIATSAASLTSDQTSTNSVSSSGSQAFPESPIRDGIPNRMSYVAPGFTTEPMINTMTKDYSSTVPSYEGGHHSRSHSLTLSEPAQYHGGSQPMLNGIGLELSDFGNSYWGSEIELGACGMLTPALTTPVTDASWGHEQQRGRDWDMDTDRMSNGGSAGGHFEDTSALQTGQMFTTRFRQPPTPPDLSSEDSTYQTGTINGVGSESRCILYLQLLHNIEQTLQLRQQTEGGHTVDSVLAANQRYLTTLLRITESPNFDRVYDGHLLFSVALSKVLDLFSVGYRDFMMRLEAHESIGCTDRLIRFGVFEIDFVEQKAICRTILVRELKRARTCLSRLMDALGREDPRFGTGRHESLCKEMSLRLEQLMCALDGPSER